MMLDPTARKLGRPSHSELQEMRERIDAGRRHIRVVETIAHGVEARPRVASLFHPVWCVRIQEHQSERPRDDGAAGASQVAGSLTLAF
jgi:hypothetical protein